MKEVKILAWCDHCASDDRREPATDSVTMTFGHGKPLTLDLCDRCQQMIITPLVELLDDYGQPEPAAVEKPSVVSHPKTSSVRLRSTCPVCSATRSAGGALIDHIWKDHLEQVRPPAPHVCPDCGFVPPPDSKRPGAAVGRHRANVHGYDPVAEALALYERTGAALERKPA